MHGKDSDESHGASWNSAGQRIRDENGPMESHCLIRDFHPRGCGQSEMMQKCNAAPRDRQYCEYHLYFNYLRVYLTKQ
jgi:hypothetical protein